MIGKLLEQAGSAYFPAFHFSLEILSRRANSLTFLTLLQLSHDWGRYKEKGSVSFYSIDLVFFTVYYECMKEVAILEKQCKLQGKNKYRH